MIELLIVISIIAILAALLLPALARAKQNGQLAACLSNLRQIGDASTMYLDDSQNRFPDFRPMKASLPGGYRPWTSWPPTDPRGGWAGNWLQPEGASLALWSCPTAVNAFCGNVVQSLQAIVTDTNAPESRYWLWRFDRTNDLTDPTMLEDFWNKTFNQAVSDLESTNDPTLGPIHGPSDVEIVVDSYFPSTVSTVLPSLSGYTVHPGGRNRQYLDGHAQFLRDVRTPY